MSVRKPGSPPKMDYEALKDAFAQIDENSDGEISKEELEKVNHRPYLNYCTSTTKTSNSDLHLHFRC